MTYQEKIIKVCKDGKWHASYEFICKRTPYGWIGSSGDREARKLIAKGLLQREWSSSIKNCKFPNNIKCFKYVNNNRQKNNRSNRQSD
jgi:hypothetical protein